MHKNPFLSGHLAVLAVILLTVTSCEIVELVLGGGNEPPRVSLSSSAYTCLAGDTITLTADASDPDGDSLTYTWYIDEVQQNSATTSTVTWTPDSSGTFTITVKVSDGEDSTEDSVSIDVTQALPTVTLSANSTNPWSDQDVTFTATASNLGGATPSYSWAVNGTTISGTSSIKILYWLASTYLYPRVSVTVTTSSGSASAYVDLIVKPAASLRIRNYSGYYLWYIYSRLHNGTWSSDYLGSNVLANNSMFVLLALSSSSNTYYDFWAQQSDGVYADTNSSEIFSGSGVYMVRGSYRNFDIYRSTWSMSASNYSSIVTSEQNQQTSVLPDAETKLSLTPLVQIRPITREDLDPDRDEIIPFSVEY
jgi:hypothetical protein